EMSPSGMPNPSVYLPPAPTALRREAMRQQGDNQLDLLEATA
ncbi:transcriptional regulator, partial [Pseudomonas aeruginosa]